MFQVEESESILRAMDLYHAGPAEHLQSEDGSCQCTLTVILIRCDLLIASCDFQISLADRKYLLRSKTVEETTAWVQVCVVNRR